MGDRKPTAIVERGSLIPPDFLSCFCRFGNYFVVVPRRPTCNPHTIKEKAKDKMKKWQYYFQSLPQVFIPLFPYYIIGIPISFFFIYSTLYLKFL